MGPGAFVLGLAWGPAGAGYSTSRRAAKSALLGREPLQEAVEIDGSCIVHRLGVVLGFDGISTPTRISLRTLEPPLGVRTG